METLGNVKRKTMETVTVTSTMMKADVLLTPADLTTVRHEVESTPAGIASFAAVMSDGEVRNLPQGLSKIIDQAFRALAANGHVTVGTLPDELTSNTAADVLGISRPTLLKLAKNGEVQSTKVGSHTRFKRDDVMAFKAKREEARREALMELLEIEDKLDDSV